MSFTVFNVSYDFILFESEFEVNVAGLTNLYMKLVIPFVRYTCLRCMFIFFLIYKSIISVCSPPGQ